MGGGKGRFLGRLEVDLLFFFYLIKKIGKQKNPPEYLHLHFCLCIKLYFKLKVQEVSNKVSDPKTPNLFQSWKCVDTKFHWSMVTESDETQLQGKKSYRVIRSARKFNKL